MHSLHRLMAVAVITLLVLPAQTIAQTAKQRPATEAEISRHLKLSSKDIRKKGDYVYKRGNPNGYKISKGQICVLFPEKREECTVIRTDGQNFNMTLRNGERAPL